MPSELELGLLVVPVVAGVIGGLTGLFNDRVGTHAKIVGGLTALGSAVGTFALASLMLSPDQDGAGMAGMFLYPAVYAASLIGASYCAGAAIEAMRRPAPPWLP